MKRTIILSRRQWWCLRTLYENITPEDDFEFETGDHVSVWAERVLSDFNGKYTEHSKHGKPGYYGKIVFKSAKYISVFLLKLSVVELSNDFSDYD